MRSFFKTLLCTAAVATMAMIGGAHAAILGSGSVSMAGGWSPTGGSSVGTATGVHFLANPAPATGDVMVTTSGGTGAFSSLTAGMTGVAKDFTFNPSSAPVTSFLTIGGFTFDLLTTHVDFQSATDLNLSGATDFSNGSGTGTGFFYFSAQGGGQPATFSWSATTTSVPEPMTLGVLGLGLAGFGVLRRRARTGTAVAA
jgi:hypothetical protein